MNSSILEKHFAAIGATVQVREIPRPAPRTTAVRTTGLRLLGGALSLTQGTHRLDVVTKRVKREQVEVFDITVQDGVKVSAVHIDPELRHLLLNVDDGTQKAKYLCGHDERHWFVAGVGQGVTTVRTAMEALKPAVLQEATPKLRKKKRLKRHTEQYVRQGEWFFVPAPKFRLPFGYQIHKHEPLRRNQRAKPHVVEELIRFGGRVVHLCSHFPTGATTEQWKAHVAEGAKCWSRTAVRDAQVYVRGTVRHSDHKTVVLQGWHRVYMNNEPFRSEVAFLD